MQAPKSPKFFLRRWGTVVGRGGLEPPLSRGTGFTARCGTNYALPTQILVLMIHNIFSDVPGDHAVYFVRLSDHCIIRYDEGYVSKPRESLQS